MSTIVEIERAIQKLSREDVARLRAWLLDYQPASPSYPNITPDFSTWLGAGVPANPNPRFKSHDDLWDKR